MDVSERDRLLRREQQRRDDAHRAADEEYAAKVAAIEMVFAMSQDIGEVVAEAREIKRRVAAAVGAKESGGATALVREATRSFADTFDAHAIRMWLDGNGGKHVGNPAISSALNKLAHRGEIVRVQPPMGRRPAVYALGLPATSEANRKGGGR